MRLVHGGQATTPEPRPAATVVVARPGRGGIEVLMLRRARSSRFGPGFLVFPGGVIDPDDAGLAERWFGDRAESARACAVRELAEEARLAAMAGGVRGLRPGEDAIGAISSSPPSVDSLPLIARWIAPEFLPVRFDAHFFALGAPPDVAAVPDGVEVDRAKWRAPAEVLAEHRPFETIMWPTFRMLQRLATCAGVDEVLALRVPQEPLPGQEASA